jgi:hypothetical protein
MPQDDSYKLAGSDDNLSRANWLQRPLAWVFCLAALLYCTAKLLLLGMAALNVQFVMDEYSLAGMSMLIPEGFYLAIDPIKTVLSVYYFLIARLFSDDALGLMLIARTEGFVLAVGMVAFALATARNLGRSRMEALLTIVVLLSFSNFMERSFRIRGDTLAAFFACAALWMATWKRQRILGPLGAGVLVGLAFLSTQKSVYVVAAIGLGYLVAGALDRDRVAVFRNGGLYGLGWALAVLAYAFYFGGFEFHRVIQMIFLSPVHVAFVADNYYPWIRRLVGQTLERNQIAYALCFLGLILALVNVRKLSPSNRLAVAATVVLSILVFLHNQPWPYVFVVALPFLSHWSIEVVRAIPRIEERYRVVLMLIVLIVLVPTLTRNVRYLSRSNSLQNQVLVQAESNLAPADQYMDGISMVPTRHVAYEIWWDKANVAETWRLAKLGDMSRIEPIFEHQPKLWILNYRVRAVWPLLERYIDDSYVRVYPNILLSGVELNPGKEVSFKNRWPGHYSVFSATGERLNEGLFVDGKEAGEKVELAANEHVLTFDAGGSSERVFLLPSDAEMGQELPVTEPVWDLFSGHND